MRMVSLLMIYIFFITNSLNLYGQTLEGMVFVEGGTFMMGDNEWEWTLPIHKVTLKSFYISKYETTVKDYRKFCVATGRKMPYEPDWGWHDNDPIVFVSSLDAYEYCEWAGVRLPTEAEWEYAARGGNKSRGYRYSGSNNADEVAWNFDNSDMKVHEIGRKQPNELGIYDMSGNVWEWCSDWHGDYGSEAQVNPKGAVSGSYRVLRGGSFFFMDNLFPVANRFSHDPDYQYYHIGFRVAKD